MNTPIQPPVSNGIAQQSGDSSQREKKLSTWRKPSGLFSLAVLAGAIFLLCGAPAVRADRSPPGCTGSGLGISLYTSLPDVHIGDTIRYSVNVFNEPFPACDAGWTNPANAGAIVAWITTPDGVTNNITLRRTFLAPGQSDYYSNVVSYVIRSQDIRSDGTVRATADDQGDIHQNDTNSRGGGNQGVNTEVNRPGVLITAQCLPSVGENGAITFTGVVTNTGNNTLVGVVVTNYVNNQPYTVHFITNLAIGQTSAFSGSWVPLNPCVPSTAILSVRATDEFTSTPRTVTNITLVTCQNVLTAGIKVTKSCPVAPVAPGQLLTYSGSVSNTGNVTLTNVVVVNSQPSANTQVLTLPTLAPGVVAYFTGSYLAPADCSIADTLIATGKSVCGVAVTDTVSATCPILTTPQITVTAACPATPVLPGGSLTYSGTVRNTGNITLTNVVVVSDRPAANTTVFTTPALAPGASASFTGVYDVPASACSVITTFSGRGKDICAPTTVTNTVSTTCTVATAPAITVTLACPVVSASTGGSIIYTGTVRNSGNVTLNNVYVVNNQPAPNTPVIGPLTLGPGEFSNFTTTFTAPTDVCSVSSTVRATGRDNCTAALVTNTASATCPLNATPKIVVTQDCPVSPAIPGGLLTYSGTVRNTGNITLTNVVVLNNLSGATPVLKSVTLVPGGSATFTGSYMAPTNCSTTSISTGTGQSICGVAVTDTVSSTCPILTAPAIEVTQTCPSTPVLPGGLLTYSGTVRNSGNITLTNVVVISDRPAANTTVFTAATLAPGATANFTGSYTVPTNCCVVWSIVEARGQGCDGIMVTATAARTCTVLTLPVIVVTKICAPGDLRPGDIMAYSGTVSNAANITLINVTVANNQSSNSPLVLGPITLAPNESINYYVSYIVPPDFCGTDTVTARGLDVCTFVPVVNSVTTTCPIITTPRIAVTNRCPPQPTPHGGALIFSGTVSNPGNVTLNNVFVVNNQPSNNTPVIGPITLAPGASYNFTGSYTAPAFCCEMTHTLTARGQDRCTSSNVTATATAICPLLYTPSIAVVQNCPPNPILMGSVYNFSGFVTNTGDAILTNVIVFSGLASQNLPLLGPIDLAPGESEQYTGSLKVPFNTCEVTVATATSQETCAGTWITNATTCPVATTPSIAITQNCPPNPVSPGGLLTYSGRISNSGNITLTNVVVLNNLSGAAPVFTVAMLAPGAGADFTGSYLSPTNCFTTSISTATGQSICGVAVTNAVSATCPILTTPRIKVTAACPPTPVLPGGLLTYSGIVRNTGNITLTNVVVVSDRPAANTTVFTAATLAPGAYANFTGDYTLPANACSITTTFSGRGKDICTPTTVTNSVSTTCTVTTAPAIAITLACPVVSASTGGLITYTGTVRNSGNVTLNNVFVVNNRPAPNTPAIGPLTLAPGATANFTASFTSPTDACSVSSTVTATGSDACTAALVTNTASATCPLSSTPNIMVSQVCPVSPAIPGGVLAYSGTVSNAGNITLTNVVVLNNLSGATPVFTSASLAPGVGTNFSGSYTVPLNVCSVSSTLTVTGKAICTGNAVTNTTVATCPVATTPSIAITQNCPPNPVSPGALLTYSGSIRNAGNITLNNIAVSNNRSGATPVLTLATLAPGASAIFSGSYTAPASGNTTSTSTVRATSLCNVDVTNAASSTCPILTTPAIAITKACPPQPVAAGGTLVFTGTVTNTGNVTLTNVVVIDNQPVPNTRVLGPITLPRGAGTNFSASYTVALDACSTTDTLIATGNDNSTGIAVTSSVSVTCPIITIPGIAITQNCPPNPASPGALLTYSGSISNAGNILLNNIVVLNDRSGATPVFTAATLAPGASAIFTGSYIAPASGDSMSTSTVRAMSLCNVPVTNSASSTCPILTSPGLAITKACPPQPVAAGGTLVFTGTVTNTGNITLTNVIVVNNQPVPNTRVLGPITLPRGAGTNFSASYTVALNACSTTDTLIATGNDSNTGTAITNSVSATCPIVTVPSIAITQNCPPNPASPGALLTYSGSISNAGNILLNNIVVLNDRSGATPVFTAATLAPGASAIFTGSYLAPASGDSMSTSTVRAMSLCNVPVTNSASSTCPIQTSAGLAITKACPPVPVAPGGTLAFTGTVTNTGNVALTNVVVVDNQPAPNTLVLGPITLAPGAGTNFTGSYLVPLNVCSSDDTLTVTGNDASTGVALTNSVSVTCALITTPGIAITQNCPANPVSPGGLLTYSGSISNAGNITLNNVVVTNNQSGNTPLISVATLAPGASANFSGSYTAPATGPTTSTSTVRATSLCSAPVTNTASSTCVIVTSSGIAITKLCPPVAVAPGGTLAFTGTVTNTGNVALTNVVVVDNQPAPNTLVLGPITLAPGAGTNFTGSYLVPLNVCSSDDTLTVTGNDASTGVALTNSVSVTCALITTPSIAITQNCPANPVSPGGLLTYSGSISNAGNITLNNVVVTNNQSGNTPLISVATLAPGASANFSGSYTAPATGPTTSTSTVRATSLCSAPVTNTASSTCVIVTSSGIAITKLCPPVPVAPGGTLAFTGTVTNTGNVALTNVVVVDNQPAPNTLVLGPITLAPGAGTNFTGSYLVPLNVCSSDNTLTVTGNDASTGVALTNSVSVTCALITTPSIAITQNCPANPVSPGGLLTYSGSVSNAGNITLNNVVVTNNQSGITPLISVATLAPGASANFSGSYTAPATGPTTSTSTVRATSLCSAPVTNTASSTCVIVTSSGIAITKLCPPVAVAPGGTLAFTGTVTNTGNVALTNVVVVDNQPAANTLVLGPITLAPGAGTNFTGSYLVPLNICSSDDTLTVTGNDASTGVAITNSVSVTCALITTPGIAITQNCPANPVSPGGLLTYSGSVSNAGNITLNNVVVTNNQSGNTPLISVATLAPGASADFSGSYTAPATGPTTSTSTVRATSLCSAPVTNTASSTCVIVTSSGIAITKLCPPVAVAPGGTLAFTGTVTNTGNVALTNVVVVDNQPAANTLVLGPITLAPGAGTNFTGSYLVPLNICSSDDTLTVTGNDASSGVAITSSVSAACALITTPVITITESCPPGPVSAGSSVDFGGLVSNTGNITLTNVFVFSYQPSTNTPVLGPITLAPGASAPFAGSYIATGGSNPTTNLTILTNSSDTITTNTVSVITTNNTATVTTNAPTTTSFGTINSVSKAVVDRFAIGTNFSGLTYAGEDHGYGATELYTMRKDATGVSFFDTIIPSTATTTDRFNASNRTFDALTYAAGDLGYGPLLFYYLSHDNAGVSTFGSITPGGVVGVTTDHFVVGNNFDALTFTATDVGYGANLFYYVRHDAAGLSTFGTINPALPGTITDRFTVGTNVDALVFTDLIAPGYGPNNFYYLRHDSSGVSTFGTIFVTGLTTATVTDRFPVGTNATELTFTATDLSFGANLFYFLRGAGLSLTTNIVTTFTTNTVITLTTNTVTTYTTNSVVSFTTTNTVLATGIDICQARTVAVAANCLGPVALASLTDQQVPTVQSLLPIIGPPTMANGIFRLSFPTENGRSYTVQYKNTLHDPTWTDLETVVGTGGNLPITDAAAARQPMRFYRVMPKQ